MHEPWPAAWRRALYGPGGFYLRPGAPARHFRTAAVAAGTVLGAAVARLARSAGCTAVVDVGAGGGELLTGVAAADPGLQLVGVDLAPRPDGLPAGVRWTDRAAPASGPALLVGWELLDVQPCPVLEVDGEGDLREVLVDRAGDERLGPRADPADAAWARRWWPASAPGDRVEVGAARGDLWQALVERVVGEEGLALAVDYDHLAGARPRSGSLTGFRDGRVTRAVPDGRHDLTAHVALDAVADRLPGSVLLRQHEALRALGVVADRPDPALVTRDPAGYLAALGRLSSAAELLDRGALGGFGWLLTPRGSAALAGVRRLAG